jgi:F-type H+-transporting ATPase subunit b
MLELNKLFFVQLANFLILFFLLNYILFKPLLRLFKERDDRTKGFLEKAKAIDKEREDISGQIDAKLAKARSTAKSIFEELSKEGMSSQKESLDLARKDAAEINKKAKEHLEAETRKARESLRKDVEAFSMKIVEKMVGV